MKRSYKSFYLGIVLISFLLTGMGSCGIFELFGERDSSPTKPCVELIPTPTPTPTPTPIPLVLITPTPAPSSPSQPSGTSDCSDGPGTAVICNGKVLSKATFVSLPEPQLASTSHIISSSQSYSMYPCSGGSISPLGMVWVAEGADQSFLVEIPSWTTTGDCYGFEVYVDGVSVYSASTPPISYTHTFSNVTTDHTIEALFW